MEASGRRRIEKGLSGLSIHLRPREIIPGAARGTKWLGTTIPAFSAEQLSPSLGPFSTRMTFLPASNE